MNAWRMMIRKESIICHQGFGILTQGDQMDIYGYALKLQKCDLELSDYCRQSFSIIWIYEGCGEKYVYDHHA